MKKGKKKEGSLNCWCKNETFFILSKNDFFAYSPIISRRIKIEDRGWRHFVGNSKIFQAFFENLKSIEKQLRSGLPKMMQMFF